MIAHTNLSFILTFAIWSSAQVLAMVLLLCFLVLCFLLNLTLFVEFFRTANWELPIFPQPPQFFSVLLK